MTEKPEPNKQKGEGYPEMESACLVCHGHGREIIQDLTYCRCRRCAGSGVDPCVTVPDLPKSAFITMKERRRRVEALAAKRVGERAEEAKKEKNDSPSKGGNGMSDLDC